MLCKRMCLNYFELNRDQLGKLAVSQSTITYHIGLLLNDREHKTHGMIVCAQKAGFCHYLA